MRIAFAIPGFPIDRTSIEGRQVRKIIDTCARRVGSVRYHPGAAVFTIDRAFHPRSSKRENAFALEILLAALCALDRLWLIYNPCAVPLLHDSGIYYANTEVWETIPALYARGWGDCKSLSACLIAEFRQRGIWCRPAFRFQGDPSATMFHILVMLEDGSWSCPSADLGMNAIQEQPGYGIPGNSPGGYAYGYSY